LNLSSVGSSPQSDPPSMVWNSSARQPLLDFRAQCERYSDHVSTERHSDEIAQAIDLAVWRAVALVQLLWFRYAKCGGSVTTQSEPAGVPTWQSSRRSQRHRRLVQSGSLAVSPCACASTRSTSALSRPVRLANWYLSQ
jgi:hypothetical protein